VKFLRYLFGLALIASVATLVATFPIESSFRSRAKLVQLVRPNEQAALFGDVGEEIGSPARYVIDDQAAFLNQRSGSGAEYVSVTYLENKGIYPLQLQTVEFVAGTIRQATTIVTPLALIGWWWSRRRLRRSSVPGPSFQGEEPLAAR